MMIAILSSVLFESISPRVVKLRIDPSSPRDISMFHCIALAMTRVLRSRSSRLLGVECSGTVPRLTKVSKPRQITGAGDGEGAKTVKPRTEEAETTEAGTQRGPISPARPRAGAARTRTGWRARPGGRTERPEVSNAAAWQRTFED